MSGPRAPTAGDYVEWPSAIRDRRWIDAEGRLWRPRGDWEAPLKRVDQLIHSPEVGVLLFYGPDAPTEVAVSDREALWQRLRRHVRGRDLRAPDDHTGFDMAVFKDEQRRSLLIIEESC